jgi:isoquinoline 1-oxidoreductase beta subunit
VPASVALKNPKDFRLIGRTRRARTAPTRPTAGPIHPGRAPARHAGGGGGPSPRFGAKLRKSFDARRRSAVKGVVDVVQIPSGVAVLASDTWTAKKGRDALKRRLGRQPRPSSSAPTRCW